MNRVYITDGTKTFAVLEEWYDRFPRYYVHRLDNGKRYLYATIGQEKCAALFLCELLNDNIEQLLAFELGYYREDD